MFNVSLNLKYVMANYKKESIKRNQKTNKNIPLKIFNSHWVTTIEEMFRVDTDGWKNTDETLFKWGIGQSTRSFLWPFLFPFCQFSTVRSSQEN